MTGLTPDEISRFRTEGYLAGLPLLDDAEVPDLKQEIETVFGACGPGLRNHILQVHTVLPWAWRLANRPGVLDRIESLLGPDVLLWKSKCFVKFPDGATVPWHQDMPHWDLDPPVSVTAWIALTPSNTDNGCVRVVPGSHRQGRIDHAVDRESGSLLTSGMQIDAPADEDTRPVTLRPGEMSFHDGFIVHGSPANAGSEPRIGVAFVFIPAAARQTGTAHGGVMLVRGEVRAGFFPLADAPDDSGDVLERARQAFTGFRDGKTAY